MSRGAGCWIQYLQYDVDALRLYMNVHIEFADLTFYLLLLVIAEEATFALGHNPL